MFKYVNVRFHGSQVYYCYWTNILDLKEYDLVLVETIHGIKTAIFIGYARSAEQQRKANKWILSRIDRKRLINNLKIELEEEGVSFHNPSYKERNIDHAIAYEKAKEAVEKSRDREAYERILRINKHLS